MVGVAFVYPYRCEEIDLSDIAGNPSPRPSPRGRGRAVSVTCQCIFFVEWEIDAQVTPLDRPLPPGEGRGEGLPATSVSSISSHPLSEGRAVGWELRVNSIPSPLPLPRRGNTGGGSTTARSPALGRTPALPH